MINSIKVRDVPSGSLVGNVIGFVQQVELVYISSILVLSILCKENKSVET